MNILKDNGKYMFYNELTIEDSLRAKNYIFNYDEETGTCWIEDFEDFNIPDKIYDVSSEMRNTIKTSLKSYNKNLGVLLGGNKGQGKSLTAKLLCREIKDEFSMPTIIINKSIPKSINFIKFFNGIKQDYCLFIDEFEKLFSQRGHDNKNKDYHEQDSFLSFMDGISSNNYKILFLLTSNEQVNEYLINRPSRIKFLQEYEELSDELFQLIVNDKLINEEFRKDLEENISLINLNIDLLISIIDDINLLNKPFSTFKNFYNYKMENYTYDVFEIEKDSHQKFLTIHKTNRKVKSNDNYVAGYNVLELIKFADGEIIFSTQEWDEDEKGNDIKVNKVIKLELRKEFNSRIL